MAATPTNEDARANLSSRTWSVLKAHRQPPGTTPILRLVTVSYAALVHLSYGLCRTLNWPINAVSSCASLANKLIAVAICSTIAKFRGVVPCIWLMAVLT